MNSWVKYLKFGHVIKNFIGILVAHSRVKHVDLIVNSEIVVLGLHFMLHGRLIWRYTSHLVYKGRGLTSGVDGRVQVGFTRFERAPTGAHVRSRK